MENAAVEFLLENLKHLQLYQAHLISDHLKNHIRVLEWNLRLFNRFLKNATEKPQLELGRQVGEVVYQAEDAVDAVVSVAAYEEVENYFKKAFDAPAKLLNVVRQVELIGAKVREIYDKKLIDFQKLQIGGPSNIHAEPKNLRQNEVLPVREEKMVGFEDEAEKLISHLMKRRDEQDVIPITGMGGLGKTTLARKVFHDPKIEYEFPIRLWVNVSDEYKIRDIFLGILRDLSWITEDMLEKTVDEISETLCARLHKEKFLIVLDDLWTTKAWDDLRAAFPKSNQLCKILITTRFPYVAEYANTYRDPFKLRFLTREESWSLLVFAGGFIKFNSHLRDLGIRIGDECDGLPLAVKLIGGILKKTASVGEMNKTKNMMIQVHDRLRTMPRGGRISKVVGLSYNMLPYYLKPCFLYLGLFPEDFKIPVWKLTLLWIAEGFIEEKSSGASLEETAEEYLKDLIGRHLVMIDKVSPSGRIKICRVHDFIREFCKSEAEEYFSREIKHSDGGVFKHSNSNLQKYRRISIHSNPVRFLSSQPYSPYVRSFLHSSQEETTALPDDVSSIPNAFKLLRVLEVKPIIFTRFPFYLTQLIHLRYVCLSSDFKVLLEDISNMWNIQTIIVYTSSRTLKIKADIWKMMQLRHLKTNASIILEKSAGETSNNNTATGDNIQTAANISPESCVEVFERANKIKSLGIRGRLATLLDDKGTGSCLFDGLQKLGHLEKLKLLNDVTEIPLPALPPPDKFPPKLMSLTLSSTFLDWKHMSILGLLTNLKVLKLKNSAFMGVRWTAADQKGFHQLQVLQIEYSNLVVWEATGIFLVEFYFPKLEYLKLRNCEKLEAIPYTLVHKSSLREIYLYRTTKSAAGSAKQIRDAIEQTKSRRLELSVFPLEDQA